MTYNSIKSLVSPSLSLRRTIFFIEWTVLILSLVQLFDYHLLPKEVTQVEYLKNTDYAIYFASFISFVALSFFFPSDRPLWQRRIYIGLEMFCIIASRSMSTINLSSFIWIVLAKSCLLLKRKDVIFLAIFTGIFWELSNFWKVDRLLEVVGDPNKFEEIRLYYLSNPHRALIREAIGNISQYIKLGIFTIFLSSALVAERKSRQKAIALTKEVETLATALERTRIAREIHDSLGHTLTSLNIQLELTQKLYSKDTKKAKLALDTSKNLASQSLTEVRQAISTMRSENFELHAALTGLIQQVEENRTFKINFQANLPDLPVQTSHQIYCLIQEALTNIQKHSQASRVDINSRTTAKEIIIEVADDGIGFDRQLPRSGFGLRGMQERLQMLGGKLIIDSNPGQGTRLQMNIPLII